MDLNLHLRVENSDGDHVRTLPLADVVTYAVRRESRFDGGGQMHAANAALMKIVGELLATLAKSGALTAEQIVDIVGLYDAHNPRFVTDATESEDI